jgi:putative tricarboxylic transport membrane protein
MASKANLPGGNVRKLGDLIGGFFFLCLGIGACIGGIRLQIGKLTEPGAGFFPFLGAVALAVLSAILLFQAWLGRSKGAKAFGTLWRPVAMIAGLIAYVAILDGVGYIIATIILGMILLSVMERRRWWADAVVALIIAVGSYILFDSLLGVKLPHGILAKLL